MKWVREYVDPILGREEGGEVHSRELWEGRKTNKKWYKATPRGLEGPERCCLWPEEGKIV